MNTQTKGSITELKIATRLIELGYTVSMPYGANARYDLVIEKGGKFSRIQCKTSRLTEGCIEFSTSSQHILSGERFNYKEEIDLFGVYNPQLDKCFLVPIVLTGNSAFRLRVEPLKIKRKKLPNYAKDFLI